MPTYRIAITTMSVAEAGTDSNVYVTLKGTNGNSVEFPCYDEINNHPNKWEQGQTDEFNFQTGVDYGDIHHIQLRVVYDGGRDPKWLPSVAIVYDLANDTTIWEFPINKFLTSGTYEFGKGRPELLKEN